MATPLRRRRLAIEALEMRQLMASDLAPIHNFRFPEDSNGSGSVSPVDLLVVINQLNQGRDAVTRMAPQSFATDINADSNLSPIDALLVLNYLNRTSSSNTIQPSSLPIESRVQFLEQWMERFGTDEAIKQSAIETLHVLRLGGRPEWGDRWIDGELRKPESRPDDSDAGAANPAFPPRDSEDSDDLIQLDPIESHPHIYPWMQRLADAGVSTELLQKLKEQWAADWEAGNDWTIDTLRQKLTEAGVDLSVLIPAAIPQGPLPWLPPNVAPFPTPGIFPGLIKLVRDIEVPRELLLSLVEEAKVAAEAGKPWDALAWKNRLEAEGLELGSIAALLPRLLSAANTRNGINAVAVL
ncbi:MAG: dockerin type I domain-containing protein [Pirellulaceae bacterium]